VRAAAVDNEIAWRFLAPPPRAVATWSVMLGRRGALGTIPIGGERVYCYLDELGSSLVDGAEQQAPERLTRLFADFAEPAPRTTPPGGAVALNDELRVG